MNGEVNVIQCPKHLQRDDLPEFIEENSPFLVHGEHYILVKTKLSSFEACEEIDGENITSEPKKISSYYIIKKI